MNEVLRQEEGRLTLSLHLLRGMNEERKAVIRELQTISQAFTRLQRRTPAWKQHLERQAVLLEKCRRLTEEIKAHNRVVSEVKLSFIRHYRGEEIYDVEFHRLVSEQRRVRGEMKEAREVLDAQPPFSPLRAYLRGQLFIKQALMANLQTQLDAHKAERVSFMDNLLGELTPDEPPSEGLIYLLREEARQMREQEFGRINEMGEMMKAALDVLQGHYYRANGHPSECECALCHLAALVERRAINRGKVKPTEQPQERAA